MIIFLQDMKIKAKLSSDLISDATSASAVSYDVHAGAVRARLVIIMGLGQRPKATN